MIYIVTYDLKKPGQEYQQLYEAIKQSGDSWWHYLDSTWLVKVSGISSADRIYSKIKPHIDRDDSVLVIEINPNNKQGWLSKEAWNWINRNA